MANKNSSLNRTHVVKRESGWAVKKEGAHKASKVYTTQKEAVQGAQKFKSSGSDVIIHKSDGSILRWEKSKSK